MAAKLTYLIQCGKYGAIKIGSTRNGVERRMKQIQSCCPYELRLLHVFKGVTYEESRLHKTFEHLNIRGEWFLYFGVLKDFIRDPSSVKVAKKRRGKLTLDY